uniref:Uncharacterized protein n=1 Tax=Molossus molossus TaxID=27622 RepID=A0A7J8JWL4_MOLMO|nr:hypothetical protein HJG59_008110 [Molossus molossus]
MPYASTAPVHGALLAQLLERPVSTCCLPSSPPASSSTHCFLPSLLHRAAFTKVLPWPAPSPRVLGSAHPKSPLVSSWFGGRHPGPWLFLSLLKPMSHLPPPQSIRQAWPLAGSAEELDRRGRGAPRTSALDHALLPDSPLRHVPRLSPPGLGRIHRPESFVG